MCRVVEVVIFICLTLGSIVDAIFPAFAVAIPRVFFPFLDLNRIRLHSGSGETTVVYFSDRFQFVARCLRACVSFVINLVLFITRHVCRW